MAEPLRWRIINLLAPGRVLTGIEIAAELGRNTDGVNKQLRVLRDAGLVSCSPGKDRRYARYQILPTVRMTPGVLDYGFCTLRLSQARPNLVAKD
jgi:predicted transcriptional regulator